MSGKTFETSLPLPGLTGNEQSSPPELVQPVLSRKVKFLTCAAVFYGNIGLALVCHVHGPALTSFQKKYKTNDETISIVFSIMTAGIALGAFLSGFLFRVVNRQLAIICFFFGMGVCMFLIPFCPTLTLFFICSGLMGIFGGFYSSAQFTWILEMMQSECPPYVIAEHFFYALGIIVSSLLLAPFLDKGSGGGFALLEHTDDNITTFATSPVPLNGQEAIELERKEKEQENKLIIPFTVMAIILELAMVFQLILFIFFRYHPPPPEVADSARKTSIATSTTEDEGRTKSSDNIINSEFVKSAPEKNSEVEAKGTSVFKRIVLIGYLGVFCGSFKGMEDNVVAFLPKYAQNGPLHISESDSAYLLSASMLAYTIARFCGIFVVYKVPPRGVLCFNMLLTLICNILLVTYARDNHTVLWVTSVLFGIGFSTAYGCFSAYMERFLHVTDGVGAFVLLYGAGIAAAYPVLIGAYIEKHPVILGYTTFISIGICSIIFAAASLQTRFDKKKY